ncbi:MAG TPA: STAS domain-containing protein [Chitinophagaceae bacterium]|nr:STAS domain-containing protein [Chitinophagaceae bacterium]
MNFKIDTKEKFHIVTLMDDELSANMTAEITTRLLNLLQNPVKNVVLNLKAVNSVEPAIAKELMQIQQTFYENNASFVICELSEPVEKMLDESELLEVMNTTPTESEAWDMVQMEEIERELLDNM